jgi:CRISPR-associated protein Cas2
MAYRPRDLYIVGYDVAETRRLRAVMERVRAHAAGGQKSLYECFLTPSEFGDLQLDLTLMLDQEMDRALLLRLDPRSKVTTLGVARPPLDLPFHLVVG